MNTLKTTPLGRRALASASAMALLAAGVGCSSNETPATAAAAACSYDDTYVYAAYYPVDVVYAGFYWADSWDYAAIYYVSTSGSAGTGGTVVSTGGTSGGTSAAAGTSGTQAGANAGFTTLAAVVGAMARGQDVCPGQAIITPKWTTPACAGGTATQERDGVTIQFNGCTVSGQTISGTFDVQSNRSASAQSCDATTVITLGHTTTATNLTITGANGKLVIPTQTDTAMTTYTYGQTPTMMTVSSSGEIQLFNSNGSLVSDLTHMGQDTVTFSGNRSYSVDGNSTLQEKNGTATATITRTGLTRSGTCDRPTGGTVVVNRSGGSAPGQTTWTFGPSCGSVVRNGTNTTLAVCI